MGYLAAEMVAAVTEGERVGATEEVGSVAG